MWLYIPSASARDSEALSEDLPSRHLKRLSQSCTASGKSALPRSLRTRLNGAGYRQLRSGLTSRPSHAARLLNIWIKSVSTASPEAIHVSRSRSQVNDVAKTIQGTYGRGLLKRLSDMHQACCSSKMSAGILFSDFQKSASVWNEWVSGLRRVCSLRLRLVQGTVAKGCSSSGWPTAGANDHKGTARAGQRRGQLDDGAEQMWPTPEAADSDKGGPNQRDSRGRLKLAARAIRQDQQAQTGNGSSSSGQNSPQQWATPAATNATGTRNSTANRTQTGKHNDGETLCDQVYPKRLNPLFVAWLMGYLEPINCELTGTQSSQTVRQWLSSLCGQR